MTTEVKAPQPDEMRAPGHGQPQPGADAGDGLFAWHLGHMGRGPGEGDEFAVDGPPRLRYDAGPADDEWLDQPRGIVRDRSQLAGVERL